MAQTLLVFGARNLGRTLAATLAAEGWRVAAVARSEQTVDTLRDAVPEALAIAADASDPAAVDDAFRRTVERFGEISLVVNAVTAQPRGSFGGGGLGGAPPDALEPYVDALLPVIWNVFRTGARVLGDQGGGTIVQVTGGSSRRAIEGRGPWAAAAFATRALTQSAALELREQGIHVALLIVDATIESDKTQGMLEDKPEDASTSEDDVVAAIRYLASQSPRAWTHELQITPRLDRWVP